MGRIFIVEDDDNIRELVCYALRSVGFESVGFENAGGFWRQAREEMPLMVILDIMLPDEDGLSVLKKLRADRRLQKRPVILLTAKSTEYDRVTGLDAGADDYLGKPFSVLELISRIRAVLRRAEDRAEQQEPHEPHELHELRAGLIALNTDRHEVRVCGELVQLTFKEFELLHFLMRHAGLVLTREKILTEIWGYDYDGGTNRTVDMHIKTLRQKLGEQGGALIITVRGLGYKLKVGD